MTITVSNITANDIAGAVDCIQVAFAEDPYRNWVFDEATFDKHRNFSSLKAKCDWGMNSSSAVFHVAKDSEDPTGKVLGVSMWTVPTRKGAPLTWADWLNDYALWIKQGINVLWYRGRGGLRTDRYWVWKREQAKAQDELLTDPEGYYFCNIVVVSPEAQGKGVGKKMFEAITKERADKEGRKCYLESSRWEPNVAVYRRLGFEVAKEMKCVSEDGKNESCDLFCMIREPQTPTL